jgi:hypothetical protein
MTNHDLPQNHEEKELSPAKLLWRGLERLPPDLDLPDQTLAQYFFNLSERKDFTDDERDLAMDAMVFCENDFDFPVTTNRAQLLARYQELFPPKPKSSI